MRVDQVIPTLAWPDAIGTHTLALTDALRRAGIASDVYYGNCPTPSVADRGIPVSELGDPSAGGRWLLYQFSIGSSVFDLVAVAPERVLVNYHNITPTRLLAPWEPGVGAELDLGRSQLRALASRCPLAIGVSEYDRAELAALGYPRTEVAPLLIEPSRPRAEPDRGLAARLQQRSREGGAHLLFVGKVSPHKAPHDLVKMLAVYRRLYDPHAHLTLVGSPLGARYADAMTRFVSSLGLEDAVTFAGTVGAGQLEAYYDSADVFVCASEHEGFCVPIIEAMARGLPVVAYGAAAVPETVRGAGLVLSTKEPLRFAAAVDRLRIDEPLRRRLVDAGRRRAGTFSPERAGDQMVRVIEGVVRPASRSVGAAGR